MLSPSPWPLVALAPIQGEHPPDVPPDPRGKLVTKNLVRADFLLLNYSQTIYSGTFLATVYLSTDSNISTSDVFLYQVQYSVNTGPNNPLGLNMSNTFSIPNDTTPGFYFVGVIKTHPYPGQGVLDRFRDSFGGVGRTGRLRAVGERRDLLLQSRDPGIQEDETTGPDSLINSLRRSALRIVRSPGARRTRGCS